MPNEERKVTIERVGDTTLRVRWTLKVGRTKNEDGTNSYESEHEPSALVDFLDVTDDEVQELAVHSLKIKGLRDAAKACVDAGEDTDDIPFSVREYLDTVPERKARGKRKVTLADVQKGIADGEFTLEELKEAIAKG